MIRLLMLQNDCFNSFCFIFYFILLLDHFGPLYITHTWTLRVTCLFIFLYSISYSPQTFLKIPLNLKMYTGISLHTTYSYNIPLSCIHQHIHLLISYTINLFKIPIHASLHTFLLLNTPWCFNNSILIKFNFLSKV